MTKFNNKKKSFFDRVPHAITIVFSIILLVTLLTYILPAGAYERINMDGRSTVVPDSYKIIKSTPIGILQMFKAIPLGFKSASEITVTVTKCNKCAADDAAATPPGTVISVSRVTN